MSTRGPEPTPADQRSQTGGVWAPERRSLTVGLVLAVTLVAFEALAIATILPVVSRHLGDLRLYGWVFSAFMLTSLIGIVVAGTLADRGRWRRPMLVGLALFAVGLVIGGTAPNMTILVAGRAVQGLGAGFVPAVAYVAISVATPNDANRGCSPSSLRRGWSRDSSGPQSRPSWPRPSVGGGCSSACRPLVIAAGVLAVLAMKHVPAPTRPGNASVPYLPVFGVVGGAAVALASISSGNVPAIIGGAIAGGSLMVACLRRLTPPRTLTAGPGLPATILNRGLLTCCFFAGDAYVPYAITTVRHSSTGTAALALTAGTLTWTAGSWVQAHQIARLGPRRLVRTGECLVLGGLGLMSVALLPSVPPELGVLAWGVAGRRDGAGLCSPFRNHPRPGRPGRGGQGHCQPAALRRARSGRGDRRGRGAGRRHRGRPRAPSGVALAFLFGILVGFCALAVGARPGPAHRGEDRQGGGRGPGGSSTAPVGSRTARNGLSLYHMAPELLPDLQARRHPGRSYGAFGPGRYRSG